MKALSLVSYILLSILVILVLSTVVQATEYSKANTEVKAEEILTHIENGDNVALYNCSIVGELDVSKKNLKTVPCPFVDEFGKWVYPSELGDIETKDKLSVIESKVTIIDSVFTDTISFSNVQFNSSADFGGVYFNNFANFEGAHFNRSANFSKTSFTSYADLSGTNFNSSADFSGTNFTSDADFVGTDFNSPVRFNEARFNSPARFNAAHFHSSADFSGTNFTSDADFPRMIFCSSADFSGTNFTSDADFSRTFFYSSADFSGTNFTSDADFSRTNFNSPVRFNEAHFNSPARFNEAHFNSSADLSGTNFTSYADFVGTNFNSSADFSRTIFNGKANFEGAKFNNPTYFAMENFNSPSDLHPPDTSENIIAQDGKLFEILMKAYNNEARYTDSDNIYYNFRKFERESLTGFSWLIDTLSLGTCGYGTKFSYTIFWAVIFIISFAIIYKNPSVSFVTKNQKIKIPIPCWKTSGIYKVKIPILYWKTPGIYRLGNDKEKSKISFLESLYFSTNIFTRLGPDDWQQEDKYRKWVALEGVLGWIIFALVSATLMKLFIRS